MKKYPFITVFTPVYNRGHSIEKVYESLTNQIFKDFEWLVINDGSTDNTLEVLQRIIESHDGSFSIRLISRENKGLMPTINEALDLANGTFFYRLDSDDYAISNATELIFEYGSKILNNDNICAVTFLSLRNEREVNGYHPFKKVKECNFLDYRAIYNGIGDRTEVMKTEIYRKFKFPIYKNEKFCPEALVWNRIALHYTSLYIPIGIYVKGLQKEDSITSKIYNCLKTNSQGSCQYYFEILINKKLPFKYRWLAAIKYYRYVPFAKRPWFKHLPVEMIITGLPTGLLILLYDLVKHRN